MDITMRQRDILKGMQMVQGIIDVKGAIPILANVLIEAVQGGIWIFATDLKIGVKSFYPGEVRREGKITVPARKFFEIVKELSYEKIDIKTDNATDDSEASNRLNITAEKYKSSLPCISADIYPPFPSYGDDCLVKVSSAILKDMIKKTIFSVSNDENRLTLNGILLELEDNSIVMVSTDGHRLSYIKRENSKQTDKKYSVILPQKTSNELFRFLDESEEDVLFGVYENHAVFRKGSLVLVSRMIEEGQYPRYESVLPKIGNDFAVLNREMFIGVLKRVSLLSDEKSRMVKFNIRHGEIELIADSSDIGAAKETISVVCEIESITKGLNAKYALDILCAMDCEEVCLYINSSTSPALFTPKGDNDYQCVIMPMRISA